MEFKNIADGSNIKYDEPTVSHADNERAWYMSDNQAAWCMIGICIVLVSLVYGSQQATQWETLCKVRR